jgi:hypothetical protein
MGGINTKISIPTTTAAMIKILWPRLRRFSINRRESILL